MPTIPQAPGSSGNWVNVEEGRRGWVSAGIVAEHLRPSPTLICCSLLVSSVGALEVLGRGAQAGPLPAPQPPPLTDRTAAQ